VSAWTEAELARKEDFVGRSLAGPSTGRTDAGVELPRPQAGLMSSGELAEASGWPAELSARVGFLEKTLAAIARARCRRRPSEWRSSDRIVVRGSVEFCRRCS
jgi:hypothetical protein